MEQITDRDSNIYSQVPTTSSAKNNVSPMAQHDRLSSSYSPHGTKRKRSNETGQSDEMAIYFDFIAELKKSCTEKDNTINQLRSKANFNEGRLSAANKQSQSNLSTVNELQRECSSKDAQLAELKSTVKKLRATIVKKNTQLQSMSDEIDELQTQIADKDAQLEEMKRKNTQLGSEIVNQGNRLKSESIEMKKELESKEKAIVYYQRRYNQKDCELAEKTNLIKQMRAKHVENENEIQIIPENLEYLEDNVNSNFDALFDCAEVWVVQKQYAKANMHYKKAIAFEKATQDRPDKLAMLFVSQAFCYGEMKWFSNQIGAADSALQYDSNCKDALYNRAFGYFNLKHYSDACQDLEKILQMDSNDADAQELLDKVQSCMNEAT